MSKEDQITQTSITESTEWYLLSHPLYVQYYTFIAVNIFESSYSYTTVSRQLNHPKYNGTLSAKLKTKKSNKILSDSRLQVGTVPP